MNNHDSIFNSGSNSSIYRNPYHSHNSLNTPTQQPTPPYPPYPYLPPNSFVVFPAPYAPPEISKIDSLMRDLANEKAKNAAQSAELAAAKRRIRELEVNTRGYETLKSDNDKMIRDILRVTGENKLHIQTILGLRGNIERLGNQLLNQEENIKQIIDKKNDKIERLLSFNEEKRQIISKKSDEIAQLSKEKSVLEQKYIIIIQEKSFLERTNKQLQERYVAVQDRYNGCTASYSHLQNLYKQKEQEILKLEMLKSSNAELIAGLKKELEEVKSQITILQKEVSAIQHEKRELEKNYAESLEKIKNLNEKLRLIKQEKSLRDKKINSLEKTVKELTEQLKEQSKKNKETEKELGKKIEALEASYSSKQSECDKLKKQIEDLHQSGNTAQSSLEIQEFSRKLGVVVQQLSEEIKNLIEELGDSLKMHQELCAENKIMQERIVYLEKENRRIAIVTTNGKMQHITMERKLRESEAVENALRNGIFNKKRKITELKQQNSDQQQEIAVLQAANLLESQQNKSLYSRMASVLKELEETNKRVKILELEKEEQELQTKALLEKLDDLDREKEILDHFRIKYGQRNKKKKLKDLSAPQTRTTTTRETVSKNIHSVSKGTQVSQLSEENETETETDSDYKAAAKKRPTKKRRTQGKRNPKAVPISQSSEGTENSKAIPTQIPYIIANRRKRQGPQSSHR